MTDYRPAQPHFDDERTLLSARPVVPLEKIHNRRNWLLGGAFVLAMMLGAGSALLASYLKLRSVREPTPQVSQEEIAPAPLPVAESAPSVEEPPTTSVVVKKESTVRHKVTAKNTSDVDLPRNEPKPSEEDDLQHIRDAVLYDQWQERRARRVRREQRRIDRYNHRDLSNLDEIFEGRKKP
jgi:hypothetical protein